MHGTLPECKNIIIIKNMKQNFRKKYLWLFAVVIACVATIASAQDANQIDSSSRDELTKQAFLLLDKIELDSPKSHADLVKLRERIDAIATLNEVDSDDSLDQPTMLMRNRRQRNADWTSFYDSLKGLKDSALKAKINATISKHLSIDYSAARREVMLKVDNVDDYIECYYTGKVITAREMPNHTVMNIEHTWPQSKGATGVAKSDMHHLFPTDSVANSTRSSLPFGMVDDPKWANGGSECDGKSFEVRKKSRGNTARAIFYFSVRYGKSIASSEEEVLKSWHNEDPVDANEMSRNDRVESVQGNRNPFIDHPELVKNISDF